MNEIKKKRIKRIFIIVIVLVVIAPIVYYYIVMAAFTKKHYDYEITLLSPDGSIELIVKEWNFLVSGATDFYYRPEGKKKLTYIGDINYKFGVNPIQNGSYEITWDSTGFTIKYYSGVQAESFEDKTTWETKSFTIPPD